MEDTIANEILKEVKDLKVAISDTNERLDKGLKEVNKRIDKTNEKLEKGLEEVNKRIDNTNKELNKGLKETNEKLDKGLEEVNGRLDKIEKERLDIIETKLDRIETGDLAVIKATLNSINEQLKEEIPNIKFDISEIKNNDLVEVNKELAQHDVRMGKLLFKQTQILNILENQFGIKPDLKLL